MIERVFDADRLNAIINHPSVYPMVRGVCEGRLDLSNLIADKQNCFGLLADHGGCVFHRHSQGLFEVHTQFLPEGRGEKAMTVVHEALRWMFTRTDAVEIWTRCPRGNLGARALARAIGGREEMVVKQGWVQEGKVIPATIFSLTIQEWMKTAPGLIEVGRWFHERLEEEWNLIGFKEPFHEDDESHNRFVGACVEMVRNGQPHKGAIFYNRVAAMEGKLPIRVIGVDPVVIDIGQICLEVHGKNFFAITPPVPAGDQPSATLH